MGDNKIRPVWISSVINCLCKIGLSRIANWAIFAFIIYTSVDISVWNDKNRVIEWDVISYYEYLPTAFIYKDPSLKFVETAPPEVREKIWFHDSKYGGRAIKTSMGPALLYLPFFFTAHFVAPILGYDANGYSLPYRFALAVSSLFYLGLALYFMRKTLSRYFPSRIVIMTCAGIFLGTNLFYYSTSEPAMSHAFSFFMISAFIFLTIKWYEKPGFILSMALGLLFGLVTLIRPTNILIILFFLLWKIKSFNDIPIKINFLFSKVYLVLIAMAASILIWMPQIIWWKATTEQFLYFSYGDERFFFTHPQIFNGLFGYRKGWLLYTPLMILALSGIPFLRKNLSGFLLPVLTFTILNIYVVLSWWAWWYGGGFGLRAFIDSYALMAIPLAAFFYAVSKKQKLMKIVFPMLLAVLIYFNLFQTKQYRNSSIHWDSMSKKAYWASFAKMQIPRNFEDMLEHPDYEKAKNGIQAILPEENSKNKK